MNTSKHSTHRFSWDTLPRPTITLAPMEDVTDTVFRTLVREWSERYRPPSRGGDCAPPHAFFTEFVRVDAPRKALAAATAGSGNGRLEFSDAERPIIAQLWGTRPEEFRDAVAALEELGFDGVDLNMGCPARKIRKAGACSALIAQPTLAAEIIAACREGSSLPLSVKTRIGLSEVATEEWCGFLLDQPIDVLTVHPRTADQMSDGWADWREVRRVVEMRGERAAPLVFGNGDVLSIAHAHRLTEQTGADGVMVGRGVFYDPLLFAGPPGLEGSRPAALSALSSSLPPTRWETIPLRERISLLEEHIRRYSARWGGRRSFEVLKKFFRNYLSRSRDENALLELLYRTHGAEEALRVLQSQKSLHE